MEFPTGAMSSLLPKLGDLLMEEYDLQKGLKKGIKDLMEELLVIQAALEKVSDVPLDQLDPLVKIWANDVRELSYAIEDSLDSFMVRVEGVEPTKPHTFLGFIKKTCRKATKLKIRREIANDVKIQVRDVKERYDRYTDVIGNTNTRTEVDPRLLAMYTKVSDLVGIEKSMDELTERLSKGDDPSGETLKVVSVVGFGGLGKTTLAKAVYDKLKKNFDCGGFVPVGQRPDTKKVLRDILLELDRELYKASATMDERQLINQLQTFLVGKSEKTLKHKPKMTQRPFGVQISSKIFRGGLLWACPHARKIWCHFVHGNKHTMFKRDRSGLLIGQVWKHFFSSPPKVPNFFPHSGITMAIMHAKFLSLMAFYSFSIIFPVKTPKTQGERDAACVWCPNSFNFCIGDYHGHAHMLAKFDVISCMTTNRPCSTMTVWVCR